MLIGLAGYGQSGKDTVGGFLCKNYGFEQIAFADLMRSAALALDPIVDWQATRPCEVTPVRYSDLVRTLGYEKAKELPEVRRFLQRVGTDMGRYLLGENIWVERTFAIMDMGQFDWVITDVRFPNEAQAVVDHGGVVARVVRPGFGAVNSHSSETALEGWRYDYIVANSGDLDGLEREAERLVAWQDA